MNLLLFSVVILMLAQAIAEHNTRVVGGQDALPGEFPFAAAIDVQKPDGKFFCGGALLQSRWVFTSGHCVYNASLFTIQLGAVSLTETDSNRVTVTSSQYILHPDFDPEVIEGDIALIVLRESISQSYYLRNAHLSYIDVKEGEVLKIFGWGQTSDSESGLSDRLQYVEVAPLSNEECKLVYGNQITDNMICAEGNYNEGTCTGDNGGALVRKTGSSYFIVGVASFISANGCESTNPSGFTIIMPYYSWLVNIIS